MWEKNSFGIREEGNIAEIFSTGANSAFLCKNFFCSFSLELLFFATANPKGARVQLHPQSFFINRDTVCCVLC